MVAAGGWGMGKMRGSWSKGTNFQLEEGYVLGSLTYSIMIIGYNTVLYT